MAYTIVRTITAFGDQRAAILKITADAATQTVYTGMGHVNAFFVGNMSGCSGWKIWANSNASGVATEGVLGISNAASGDQCFIVVLGR